MFVVTTSLDVIVAVGHDASSTVTVAVPVTDGSRLVPGHVNTFDGQFIVGPVQQFPITVTLNEHVVWFPQKS